MLMPHLPSFDALAGVWHIRLYYNTEQVSEYNASQRALLTGPDYVLSLCATLRPSQQTQHLQAADPRGVAVMERDAKEDIMRRLHLDQDLQHITAGFWSSTADEVAMVVKEGMPVFLCSKGRAEQVCELLGLLLIWSPTCWEFILCWCSVLLVVIMPSCVGVQHIKDWLAKILHM